MVKKSISIAIHNKSRISKMIEPSTYPSVWSKTYYKEFPRMKKIELPVGKVAKSDLFASIIGRESRRDFTNEPININDLSRILFFSAGIRSTGQIPKRMYPSAGARYPLEIYVIVLKQKEVLKQGIYHYNVKHHLLEQLAEGSYKSTLEEIAGEANRKTVSGSAMVIALSGVFGRSEIKYGSRAYRFTLIEAGHMVQNLYLVAQALDLACCAIGGFIDKKINKLLRLEEEKEQSLYLVALGHTS